MKIGLIAMSGVRVRNQELAELGVTLPQFVDRSARRASQSSSAPICSMTLTTVRGSWT